MNMHLGVDAGLLGNTGHVRAETAVLEAKHRHGGVVHFDGRMIEVGPVAADLGDRAHEPAKQVELMRRLIDKDAAALALPLAAPWVRLIVRWLAPTIHSKDAEDRLADFAGVDGCFHTGDRFVPAALTDNAE